MNLYVQGWEADRLFYKQHYFQGLRGRYGLGEGAEEWHFHDEPLAAALCGLLQGKGTVLDLGCGMGDYVQVCVAPCTLGFSFAPLSSCTAQRSLTEITMFEA